MNHPTRTCPNCNAPQLPAWMKSRRESASRIGQYQHDHMAHIMDAFDIDHVIVFDATITGLHIPNGVYKRARKCMRFVEEKLQHETITSTQAGTTLGIFAGLISDAIASGRLSEDSGCFVHQWLDDAPKQRATPDTPAAVYRVNDAGPLEHIATGAMRELHEIYFGHYIAKGHPTSPHWSHATAESLGWLTGDF